MRARQLQIALGAATLGLGAVTLVGWHTGLVRLVQPLPDKTPMAYNTAVCFLLNGIGLMALGRGRGWSSLPGAALLLATASLAEDGLGVNLGIPTLLFTPYTTSHTPIPGDMALNTALAHLVAAFAVIALSWSQGQRAGIGAVLSGWFVTTLAFVCLMSYAAGIEPAYRWGPFTSMAPNTGAGLALLGLGVAAAGISRTKQRTWIRLGFALGLTTMAAAVVQAIASPQVRVVPLDSLAVATLAAGLTMAALVGLSVLLGQAARDRSEELERTNVELQAVVERNRLLSAAVDQAGEAVVISDLAGGVQYVNPAFTLLTGYSRGETVGKNLRLLKSGRHSDEFYQGLWSTLMAGRAWRGDIVNRRKDGSFYLDSTNIHPIRDPAGALTHFIAIKEDVTERRAAEEALHASEARFRLLFERTADAVLLLDPAAGRFIDCNQAAVGMLRYPDKQALLSLNPLELSPPRQPDGRLSGEKADEMLATAVGEGSHRFEWIHRSAHRADFPVEELLTPIQMGDRQLIMATWRDMSERERAEAALRRLADIVENTTDLVGQTDDTGRLAYINAAGLRMLGADRLQDVLGRPIEAFHTPESAARIVGEGIPGALRNGVWRGETELLAVDGRIVPVSQVILLGRGEDGTVTHTSTIIRDLSERKQAEAALREREFWLRESQSAGRVGSYDLDLRTQTWKSSEVLDEIFGLEHGAERTLMSWNALVHPEEREEMLRYFHQTVVAHRQGFDREYRIVRVRDGAVRWVWGRGALRLDDHGIPIRMTGTIQDITERRSLEAQLRQSQKIEAVGQLAGGVAHDFNNILGVITGYSGLLMRDLGPEHAGLKRLEQIQKAAERAAALTRQLLAFSRKQVMQPKLLDLNALVADTEKMLGRLIGEDIEVVIHMASGLGTVRADPGQMEQVLLNLVVNARDAMPQGGSLILETANVDLDEAYCAAHASVTPGRHVMMAISDTGMGLDDETRHHIFEPFFTTKPEGKGTGLGLATVYGIVKQSGGHIWIYSEPGRGATFKIYLPRVDEAAEVARPADPPAGIPGGDETILLVEDTETLREVIQETLAERGYTVLAAANGEEALALARDREGHIHLLLTDVVMPKLGGGDLATLVTALRPDVRVLYMSGYTTGAISHHGVLGEGVMLLEKPFTGDRLARAVREALDRHAASR